MAATDHPAGKPTPSTPAQIPRAQAFKFWLKLGFISFGGPAGQIAIMHQELVERRRWISERRFLHALNYTMLLPGPEAQQLATYLGWLMHGTFGGIVAGSLFVLPSFILLVLLAWVYLAFGDLPAVAGVLYGIKPAVTAIVLFAAYRIGSRALGNPVLWAIAALAFIGIFAFRLPFPYIIIGAAAIGFIGGRLAPERFTAGNSEAPDALGTSGDALIGDNTPPPPHAAPKRHKLLAILATAAALWVMGMLILGIFLGAESPPSEMAWFFSKAALVTFGGAYAVLPYVFQGAVEAQGWLTPSQMIDGLALGETTPGPLIMVVTFIGFVGGWTKAFLGPDALFVAGVLGAASATFFTFLPSFLFILAGGPLVEATRDDIKLTAPLTAITAAVVGVILNLALFFAYHVLWPQGFAGSFDGISAMIGIVCFIALARYGANVMLLILGSAALGFATQALPAFV